MKDETTLGAKQNVTVPSALRFYTAISVQGEKVMNKCPVISLQGRQRQKSGPENSSSLSAMLSDGIGDMPAQAHARVYAFRKPVPQGETQTLPGFSNSLRTAVTMTEMPPEEL
ncbi:hypothetical protein ACFQUU_02470 [Herbaspirillum sp. GCM10030257]|uniref:hypothetical protein n=1 Tax=Herbaspirillum sp. GCM10030257 TaxID=3273393 RepID=UPI003622E45B